MMKIRLGIRAVVGLLLGFSMGLSAEVVSDGATADGFGKVMNREGGDGADVVLSSVALADEPVLLLTQVNSGLSTIPIRTAFYPDAFGLTGGAYTVSVSYRPSDAPTGFDHEIQVGGVAGLLDTNTERGLAFSIQPGGFSPARFQMSVIDFQAATASENDSLEGLFNLDGTVASRAVGSSTAEVGDYQSDQFAWVELSVTEPSEAQRALVTGATAIVSGKVYQGEQDGSALQVGDAIELITTLPLPEASDHRAGLFGVYNSIFPFGDPPIGYFDDLTIEGDLTRLNSAPSVALTAPEDGTQGFTGDPIAIAAEASDLDGSIAGVEFFVDGESIGLDEESPYAVSWSSDEPGTFEISATATDDQGATATTSSIEVTLETPPNQAPSVAIISPADGGIVPAGSDVTVSVEAADSDGAVRQVRFFVNGGFLNGDDTAPYTASFVAPEEGDLTVSVEAEDNELLRSELVSINLRIAPNQAPLITLVAPTDGATAEEGMPLRLEANAFDTDGTVADVRFFDGDALVATVAEQPFVFNWSDGTVGSHQLTAVARDDKGAETRTASVSVTITERATVPIDVPVSLSFEVVNGQLKVSWPEAFTGSVLQSSPGLNGPWSDVEGSSTGASTEVGLAGASGFFRLSVKGTAPDNGGETPPSEVARPNVVISVTDLLGQKVLSLEWGTGFNGWILQRSPSSTGGDWVDVETVSGIGTVVPLEGAAGVYRLVRP